MSEAKIKVNDINAKNIITNIALMGGFSYAHFMGYERIEVIFLWLFSMFTVLSWVIVVMPLEYINTRFTPRKRKQYLLFELALDILLVYFGYIFLATVGIVAAYLIQDKLKMREQTDE